MTAAIDISLSGLLFRPRGVEGCSEMLYLVQDWSQQQATSAGGHLQRSRISVVRFKSPLFAKATNSASSGVGIVVFLHGPCMTDVTESLP